MQVKITTNKDEVIEWKSKRDAIKRACLVGFVPIGNRPKPVYEVQERTQEQLDDETFERECDRIANV